MTLLSQNNFIVPEIQQYVWGENEGVITKFLSDLKNKIEYVVMNVIPSSENKINIGFCIHTNQIRKNRA